jgi:hypothetical protein
MDIFVYKDDQQQGPFNAEQVKASVANGTFSNDDLAWYEGLEDWAPISSIDALKTTKKSIITQVKKVSTVTPVASTKESLNTRSGLQGSLYYVQRKGNQVGPFSVVQLKGGIKAGIIKKGDKACAEGSEEWIPLKKVPGI